MTFPCGEKKLPLRGSWLASARLRRGVMGGSGWKIRTTHSRNAPHPPLRRSPFPGGEGWGKSFPSGRCVAQRIESNIAAGWQLYHKKWCWLASARLRRGVMGGSGGEIRTTLSRNAPHPPLRRSPFPGGEGWELFLRNHWNPFVTIFISSAGNPLIRGHKCAMISRAQMCCDDAIQEGMCL